ncbi:MAG: hypothetical protein AB7F89_02930 [Pirellulaceae bacterium]
MTFDTTASLTAPIVLHLGPALSKLSDAEFQQFCELNRDWRIERTVTGDLVIMPPTGGGAYQGTG